MSGIPHACRLHGGQNGTMTLYIKKELAEEIKECFPPLRDFSAVFDQEAETITIFKPKLQ
jgi:hypothetical protein